MLKFPIPGAFASHWRIDDWTHPVRTDALIVVDPVPRRPDFWYVFSTLPAFANVEEAAAFWDSHDFTDFATESLLVQITAPHDRELLHSSSASIEVDDGAPDQGTRNHSAR
jgi:hypothetical protein